MYFCNHANEKKMEWLHGEPASSSKTTNGKFFTAGKSLVVISSVHRMLTSITSIVWQMGEKVDGEKSEYLFSMASVSWV